MELVKIIIPIYKAMLSPYEEISLKQACHVLNNYPITVVKPKGLNLCKLSQILCFLLKVSKMNISRE